MVEYGLLDGDVFAAVVSGGGVSVKHVGSLTVIRDELAKVLRDAELRAQFAKLGAEAVGNSPAEFAAFFKEESARWGRIIRERGIKPE